MTSDQKNILTRTPAGTRSDLLNLRSFGRNESLATITPGGILPNDTRQNHLICYFSSTFFFVALIVVRSSVVARYEGSSVVMLSAVTLTVVAPKVLNYKLSKIYI